VEPARSVRKRDTLWLRVRVWLRFRSGRTLQFSLERSLHRGVGSDSGTDWRLRGDEVGGPILGHPPSMVVVDLIGNRPEPSGTSVWRSRGSGSNPASGAGMGVECAGVAKALMFHV
jgi:hypothetical protein